MKIPLFCIVACLVFYASCSDKSLTKSSGGPEYFADSMFQSSVDSGFIAGASVLVVKKGEVLIDKSYGFASLELDVPMPTGASFEIGSVTKQFTSAAILRLMEMGEISLDDDLTQYVDFNTGGRKIKIGDLLDHRSGIPSYTEIPDFWPLSLHAYPRDTLLRIVEKEAFLFEPGSALIYNNSAYYLLGLIIESVADTSYEAFLDDQIFKPLGMGDTYYCSTSEVVPNKVYGYNFGPDGLRQKPYLDHTWPFSAGSLCSTTADLMKWMKALHGGKVLKEPTYLSMITPGSLNDGSRVRYAKGLVNYMNYGHKMIGHGGGINGFLSETLYFPEEDLFIVCLVNTTGPRGAGYFAEGLTWALLSKTASESAPGFAEVSEISGMYEGQVRGSRVQLNIKAFTGGFTLQQEGEEVVDTVRTYIGSNTWKEDNDTYSFTDKALHIDVIYNHYVLMKQ